LPDIIINLGYWSIPTLFLIRRIGDFKHAGFFKKVKDTKFGKADTKYFSPLCLFVAVIGYVMAYSTLG